MFDVVFHWKTTSSSSIFSFEVIHFKLNIFWFLVGDSETTHAESLWSQFQKAEEDFMVSCYSCRGTAPCWLAQVSSSCYRNACWRQICCVCRRRQRCCFILRFIRWKWGWSVEVRGTCVTRGGDGGTHVSKSAILCENGNWSSFKYRVLEDAADSPVENTTAQHK